MKITPRIGILGAVLLTLLTTGCAMQGLTSRSSRFVITDYGAVEYSN